MTIHNTPLFYATLGVLVFDGYLLGLALRNLRGATRARRWKRVPATVVDSRLVLSPVPMRLRYRKTPIPTYWPEIDYRYVVHRRTYHGTRIFAAHRIEPIWEPEARVFIARFPAGGIVECSYNPENPAEAVLLPCDLRIARRYLGLVVALTLLAALMGFLSVQPLAG